MKIERHKLAYVETTVSIDEFADKYNLIMEIRERSPKLNLPRYYVNFKNVEIKDDGVLISAAGNGNSELEAIADYAKQISGQLLIVDAYKESRRQIKAPQLTVKDLKLEE